MRKWIMKPVNFDSTNPDEKALYDFAGTLPNFTFMVKNWLRSLRDEQANAPTYHFISSHVGEPEIDTVDADFDQFL